MMMMMTLMEFLLFALVVATMARSDTIQASDGDYVMCTHITKQPSFINYSPLKDHKIQERPSSIPQSISRPRGKWKAYQTHVSTAHCPEGTVPIRQLKGVTANRTQPSTAGHEYATRASHTTTRLFGTKTIVSVWKPEIEKGAKEFSLSQIWLTTGSYKEENLNTIEVGWQVFPDMYMDTKPRLFIFWTNDSYANGCYNLRCAGFIQVSNTVVIEGSISPISVVDGSQFELTICVWKDQKSGNWWLSLGNEPVGYWPKEIFTTMNSESEPVTIAWGGEIVNSLPFGRHTRTQMGSGHYPEEGFGKSSYFRNLEVVDSNNKLQPMESIQSVESLWLQVDNTSFYDISTGVSHDYDWGMFFFYGGPGSGPGYISGPRSGAVRLSVYLPFCFVCFSFLLFV